MEPQATFESLLKDLLTAIINEAIRNAIIGLTEAVGTTVHQGKEILTVEEAADFLSISKSKMYKLTSSKTILYYNTGKKIYFRRDDLLEWVTKHRIKTQGEIEMEAATYTTTHKKKW